MDGDDPDRLDLDQTNDVDWSDWAGENLGHQDGPGWIVIEPSQPWDGLVEDPVVVECAPPWSEEVECWDEEVRRENAQRSRPFTVLLAFLRALRILNHTFSCHM